MGVRAISHIAIGVTDMEQSIGFYRDVVGLRVRQDQVERVRGTAADDPHERRVAHLCYGEGPHEASVVLDQQLTMQPFGEAARLYQTGVHHFAFWVDDLDDAVERAGARKIEVAFGPAETGTETYGEPAGGQIRTVIVYDPDGNLVQLDQRL